MHHISEPNILYFGTPVVLVSTMNEDGSYNLAPISSAFWLGWRCIIGMATTSKTVQNLVRTKQCVLNLPSVHEVQAVNNLALKTGANPVPTAKQNRGYYYEPDKFGVAGLTPVPSQKVTAPRVMECPVQLEAHVAEVHPIGEDNELQRGCIVTMELKIVQVYLEQSITMNGDPNRVDPDKWRPLIMSFQQFYGLGHQIHASSLASIPEYQYKSPDIETARNIEKIAQPLSA
ncbi:flavin reductase family protein [Mucilaginibacter sp. SP1R1]|uniref:flavin reductase family protein n=1 Tax=Mucilaginibacter sp. SP1R1 TaxID=2723091 RepID=UPI00160ACA05|nr:flavin reductase family protein [Mucilaginibacter sp. SP1R1]MBB6150877.1 flavin reductase (DIM6/NTAB) family NADH-FMN oxidoreductase RutF [Mucilaginibacter sp. SP1R1]